MGSTVTDPLVGRLVDGRYEVRSRIARGGMATVYLALDRRLDREVALKVMHPHLAEGTSGADFVARFRREARTAARLAHPGLVSVFDQGVDGETSYLTMEYVEGTTLRRRLGDRGALSVGETLRITEAVLDALTAAHRAGLVHRDIKPENVLIDADDRVKLGDFGLARAVTEVTSTTTGTVLGTVAYLAPELVGRGVTDARTDIYACGILLFEMLTGRQPFTGETPIQVAFQHVNSTVPAPSSLVEWLPSEVDELVEALAARDPAERPLDAGAALALVRRTRAALDEETLERHADVAPQAAVPSPHDDPSQIVEMPDDLPDSDDDPDERATTVLQHRGSTVALPIGLGGLGGLTAQPAPARRRRRRLRWLIATLVTLGVLAGLAGGGYWWYGNVGPGAYTTVPAVNGVDEQEALSRLAARDLQGVPTFAFSDDVPQGEVFAADPQPGDRVVKGGAVTYTVSKGVDLVTVPDGIVGVLQDQAVAALAGADLTVGYGDPVFDDAAATGQVMSATVAGTGADATAGTQIKRGSQITLVLAKGPWPVTVGSLVGATVEEATAQLEKDQLALAVAQEAFSDEVEAGHVISQVPEQGAIAHHGDTVQVVVSKGPDLVPLPNVYGMKADKAKKALEEAGFTVTVNYPLTAHPWNLVTSQQPEGGDNKTAKRGAAVTISVV